MKRAKERGKRKEERGKTGREELCGVWGSESLQMETSLLYCYLLLGSEALKP